MLSPRVKAFLAEWIGSGVLRALCRSLRLSVCGDEALETLRERHGAICFCLWHADMLVPLFHHRHSNGCTLVSEHDDGELIARALRRMGYALARGSTTRGGVRALAQAIRLVRGGHDIGISPDGPRGPRHVVQPGIVYVAQKSGCPIVPIGVASARYWEFRSWDRFRLPKPWARAQLWYGEPLHVPPKLTDEQIEAWRRRVETALEQATRQAEVAVGLPECTPSEQA